MYPSCVGCCTPSLSITFFVAVSYDVCRLRQIHSTTPPANRTHHVCFGAFSLESGAAPRPVLRCFPPGGKQRKSIHYIYAPSIRVARAHRTAMRESMLIGKCRRVVEVDGIVVGVFVAVLAVAEAMTHDTLPLDTAAGT